jgi:hippurate hydrolase
MGASEDFAQALKVSPGAFFNFGNGDSAPLHSPKYDFDDAALTPSVKWFVELVRSRLPISGQ